MIFEMVNAFPDAMSQMVPELFIFPAEVPAHCIQNSGTASPDSADPNLDGMSCLKFLKFIQRTWIGVDGKSHNSHDFCAINSSNSSAPLASSYV